MENEPKMRQHPQITIRQLLTKVQPRTTELKKAMAHSFTVRKRLNRSFNLKKFIKIGSHTRGTAIRSFSDVDFLAVLARNEAKWAGKIVNSSTFLQKVRDDLDDRYTHTAVRRDIQAVVVQFGGGQHSMDVVPAIFSRFDKSRPVYWIPDGNGAWLETSPEGHHKYIMNATARLGAKLTKLLQLLKWWKFCRSEPIPIFSFHVDMMISASDVCKGVKPYTRCLHDAFQFLSDRECRGFRDPIGIAGVIVAAKTDTQIAKLQDAVDYALYHAKEAIQAESWKDYEEANHQWNIVFNGY